jgi:hypothetical protein
MNKSRRPFIVHPSPFIVPEIMAMKRGLPERTRRSSLVCRNDERGRMNDERGGAKPFSVHPSSFIVPEI